MNVENILRVADAIEKHEIKDLGFNMNFYGASSSHIPKDRSGHNCNTVACIAGWTAVVGGFRTSDDLMDKDGGYIKSFAQKYMDIDWKTSSDIFIPPIFLDIVMPGQAVRTLRHFAATGEVNWDLPDPA